MEMAMNETCLVSQKQDSQRECFCVHDKLIMEMKNSLLKSVCKFWIFIWTITSKKYSCCAKDLGLKYSGDVDEIVRQIGSIGLFAKGAGIARYAPVVYVEPLMP